VNSFSPNMLKTYNTCPKKYYYKFVEQLNIPVSFLKFEKGKKIHALANYYLQGVNISRIEKALTEEERVIWNSLLDNPFFGKKCCKSEYSLSCKTGEYWVGGRLDAVVYDNEGFYILDYKTGSVPQIPEYDFQTMIYLLCLNTQIEKGIPISFVYIDLKNTKNYVIKFNDALKAEYTKRLTKACKIADSDTVFNCTPSAACKMCEYSVFCPQQQDIR